MSRESAQEPRQKSQMQHMARRAERHEEKRLPQARPPEVIPFPPRVVAGLWFGILFGALLGLIWGILLRSNVFVVPNWEGLYSMTPLTFHVFWLLAGAALGILAAALIAFLPEPPRHEEPGRDT